jgi:hypothetical protein
MEQHVHGEYAHMLKLLRSALERERQRRIGVAVSVQALVPALEHRLSKRLSEIASNSNNSDKRARGAK